MPSPRDINRIGWRGQYIAAVQKVGIVLALIVAGLWLVIGVLATPAAAQANCAPRDTVLARLSDAYDETLRPANQLKG